MIFKNIEMCIRDRGYVERMPDQAGLTNRGRLVIRLTAQKDAVSAAESEQQASTGDLSLIHILSAGTVPDLADQHVHHRCAGISAGNGTCLLYTSRCV